MKVLVAGLGSAGDVHPMTGLALALERRGHQVRLIGLGTGQEYREALHDPDLWHPYRAFGVVCRRLILPAMRRGYEIVAQQKESGLDLVVAPATAFGARIAGEKLGVPLATVRLQPALFRSVYQPPCYGYPDVLAHLPRPLRRHYWRAVDRFYIDRLLAPEVNAFRAELGLAPVRRLFDRWVHSEQLILGFFPEWFAPPQPDWPPHVHLVGFPLFDEGETREPSAELTEFLDSGEPPVVFTAGSANVQAREFFRVSVEVCRAGGYRGILLTQFAEVLPPRLCEGVRHFEYIPFSRVFPRARAVVHHGGIGTVAKALAAGVPQLVVPAAHDQPDNAARVCRLGVGSTLRPSQCRTKAVLASLDRMLHSPGVTESCRKRSREMDGNAGLEKACLLLEEMGGS